MIRNMVLVLLLALALAGMFLVLRPEELDGEPRAQVVDLREDGMAPDEIIVGEGDRVTLRVTADEPGEFHLHGYDLERRVEPGERTGVSFEATLTGRFEIEGNSWHTGEDAHSHQAAGARIVEPR